MRALLARSATASMSAARVVAAASSDSVWVRYPVVAARTSNNALESIARRRRIVSCIAPGFRATGSVTERDADDGAEVAHLGAFLRISGLVHLALRRAVAGEAGFGVIFRHHDAKGGPAVLHHRRERLAARPVGLQQLGCDHIGLPRIGPSLAVAHEVERRGDLDFRFALRASGERLVDQPREHRRDEPLEPGPLGVDLRLVLVHHLDDRIHYGLQQYALTRL